MKVSECFKNAKDLNEVELKFLNDFLSVKCIKTLKQCTKFSLKHFSSKNDLLEVFEAFKKQKKNNSNIEASENPKTDQAASKAGFWADKYFSCSGSKSRQIRSARLRFLLREKQRKTPGKTADSKPCWKGKNNETVPVKTKNQLIIQNKKLYKTFFNVYISKDIKQCNRKKLEQKYVFSHRLIFIFLLFSFTSKFDLTLQ